MKYKIGLFFILFPVFAMAQTKIPVDSLARIVLNDLVASWTLGIDSTTDVVDIKTYNKFKSLFDVNATIDNDLNVFYRYNSKKKSGSYQVEIDEKPRTFDVYSHDVVLQIKSIIIDSVETINSNDADKKNIIFTIKRAVEFTKPRQYVLPESYADEVINGRKIDFEDRADSLKMIAGLKNKISENPQAIYKFSSINTLRVAMAFEMDTVRITSIKSISNQVICTNDADQDAVLDLEDSLRNKPGDFTKNGTPDYDLDGIPDDDDKCKSTYGYLRNKGCPFSYFFTKHEFNGFIGLQVNSATINLPGLNQLGYKDASGNNALDVLQSKKGNLKNPGTVPGVCAGGSLAWYFGQKRKQAGISVGFAYFGISADYQLTEPTVYTYKKQFDNSYFYRRRITDSSLNEGIKYNVLNFPVLFNYRMHLDKNDKAVLSLRAGPSFMFFINTSSYNATIDVGGLYQTDPATGKIIYNDYFDPAATSNLYLTSKNINAQNPNPGAAIVFNQLGKNYDFADNKTYIGKQHLNRFTIGFNVNVDLQYKISEGLTIRVGPSLVYAPLLERKEKYKPIDNTSDEYQSIYKSTAKSNYSAFGLNIGFVYNF